MRDLLKKTAVVAVVIIVIIAIGLIYTGVRVKNAATPYCQEYIPGGEGVMGTVNVSYFEEKSEHYAIGANSEGYAVFKTPYAAFREMKTTNRAGKRAICKMMFKEAHILLPLTPLTCELYGTYGWQVYEGSEKAKEQADFISAFADLYENSGISVFP